MIAALCTLLVLLAIPTAMLLVEVLAACLRAPPFPSTDLNALTAAHIGPGAGSGAVASTFAKPSVKTKSPTDASLSAVAAARGAESSTSAAVAWHSSQRPLRATPADATPTLAAAASPAEAPAVSSAEASAAPLAGASAVLAAESSPPIASAALGAQASPALPAEGYAASHTEASAASLAQLSTALPAEASVVSPTEASAASPAEASAASSAKASAASNRIVVLIPAHDEARGIARTIATIHPQLRPCDGILVVADNCSDDTAAIARAAGATVIERTDARRRGKGWALAAGVSALTPSPPAVTASPGSADPERLPFSAASDAIAPLATLAAPDVVIIVDADCTVAAGCLDALRDAARTTPAQAVYLMLAPADAPPPRRLAELLFTMRNWTRPLGLARLGAPCLLTGAGIALPWSIARHAPLGSGSVVEDVQLAIDLARAGTPPRLCPMALVLSAFPTQECAAEAQRTRWLWGALRTLLQAPGLAAAALRQRRADLLALALELAIPPLSLLIPAWLAVALAGLPIGLTIHDWRILVAASAGLGSCMLAIALSWLRFARARIPASVLLAAPLYALPFVKSVLVALARRRQRWNRTARD